MPTDRETDDLIKRAVLSFLGEDSDVRQQFLLDLTFPQPPAPAPQIMFEILPLLRDMSQLFYGTIASLFAAYLYHYITHKGEAKRFRRELETQMRTILQEHDTQIEKILEENEKLRSRFQKVNLRKVFIRVPPNFRQRWEIRLKVYNERANFLLSHDEATELIIKIFDDMTYDNRP